MTPTQRKACVIGVLTNVEALQRDVTDNPTAHLYSPNACAVSERLQAAASDLLHEAIAGGWITREEARETMSKARHTAAEQDRRRLRVPR